MLVEGIGQVLVPILDCMSEFLDLDPNDFDIVQGIEQDKDKHKAKLEMYRIEKEQLLKDKWTGDKKGSNSTTIKIGVRVQERHG